MLIDVEAHVRGEAAWVRRSFGQSLFVAFVCILALAGLTWQARRTLRGAAMLASVMASG